MSATFFWYVCNRWLRDRTGTEKVEWQYCFDVHCNAWLVLFLYLYVLEYALLPALIVPNSWISTVLGNSIVAAGTTHYLYITFVGYSSLPFLKTTNFILYPVIGLLGLLILLTVLLKFNVVIFIMNLRYS